MGHGWGGVGGKSGGGRDYSKVPIRRRRRGDDALCWVVWG